MTDIAIESGFTLKHLVHLCDAAGARGRCILRGDLFPGTLLICHTVHLAFRTHFGLGAHDRDAVVREVERGGSCNLDDTL